MATTKTKYRRTSKGSKISHAGLASQLDKAEKLSPRIEMPGFKAGDTVRVHVKIREGEKERVQIYEGLVIAQSNRGASRSFTVRKMSHGVGVERIFLETSPRLAKVEIVQEGLVRRAKLYYIRELEGRAAKIERDVETQAAAAQSAASKKTSVN